MTVEQFAEFENQCKLVLKDAESISNELGWGRNGDEAIENYVRNFLEAVAFARDRGSDQITIG